MGTVAVWGGAKVLERGVVMAAEHAAVLHATQLLT